MQFSGNERRVYGFIDGSFRQVFQFFIVSTFTVFLTCALHQQTCRPVLDQRLLYSGYYRSHGLKYQAIVMPYGLCYDLAGPYSGRWADGRIFRAARTFERLSLIQDASRAHLRGADAVVYADPAYALSAVVEKRAMNELHRTMELRLNARNSAARIAVEWYFGRVSQKWLMLNDVRRHRVIQSPVAVWYRAACFLTNVVSCLNPNQISQAFNCEPPTAQEYLATFGNIPDNHPF
jgi:hypothetical protein